jgi:hypothetical protein
MGQIGLKTAVWETSGSVKDAFETITQQKRFNSGSLAAL